MGNSLNHLIITGNPGIGKTTLIKECTLPFRDHCGGFYTEELKEGSKRVGFNLKTFDDQSGILAQKGLTSDVKLNKYGVNLKTIDELGLNAIQKAIDSKKIIVIDEIGTMEMLSTLFCDMVIKVLGGLNPVLATIRQNAEPFTSQIKKMSDVKLMTLTRENFIETKSEVRSWIEKNL